MQTQTKGGRFFPEKITSKKKKNGVSSKLARELHKAEVLLDKGDTAIRTLLKELDESRLKYKNLYDGMPDLCRTINLDGIIIDCNKAYAKSLGYSKGEIIGKSIFDHTAKESLDAMRNSFETWRNTGIVVNREVRLKKKDGETFPVLVSATNLYDSNNQIVGSNTLIKDISEIEALLKVDKAKSEFASMISHELKTPLIPIMAYSEMLLDPKFFGKLKISQQEAIREIHENSVRLNKLIGDVLKAQKLEIEQFSFTKNNFAVQDLMETVYKNNHSLATKKQARLELNFPPKNKLIIKSDHDRILEVFTNLIRNASSYVPKKDGRIEVGVRDGDTMVLFYVKDNGTGIPLNKQKNLFTKFYQVDTSHSRSREGSGLGLVICKGIVEGLGGKIWVKSDSTSETVFYFSIPKNDV